ncbi:Diaminohydroxyphosphoribosylaminopyrimidine deaminase / 5-amino-6-(5-phosphoribosylamino)uracil reductase [hydrothermal vent metagenome]|uniref:5-amino-6-(5-phosphoribosylamino)uracil reductase n=1 Tax=hydrothermal vent metagenome TaxID=652676 RepID=A0A1W1EK27_9ZZZZ
MSGFNDKILMNLAIYKAWKYQGLTYPNPAVGALVVDGKGEIVSIEAHQKAGTSHAEVLALLSAYEEMTNQKLPIDKLNPILAHRFLTTYAKDIFKDCTIYVTLEPCSHIGKTPSCASLLIELAIKRVVVATTDPISSHSGGVDIMKYQGIQVKVGVEEEKAKELIEPFLIWQNRAFVLFKIAQTFNGKIGGGYLSCQSSLTHTHKLREVADKILIGGNTVRLDRPKLDCRFIEEAISPDIYIYSKSNNLDRDIPLFNIPHRNVEIGDDLSFLDNPSFVIVEGGEGMLNAIKDKIDWLLIYQTSTVSTDETDYRLSLRTNSLHQRKIGEDMMLWSKTLK